VELEEPSSWQSTFLRVLGCWAKLSKLIKVTARIKRSHVRDLHIVLPVTAQWDRHCSQITTTHKMLLIIISKGISVAFFCARDFVMMLQITRRIIQKAFILSKICFWLTDYCTRILTHSSSSLKPLGLAA